MYLCINQSINQCEFIWLLIYNVVTGMVINNLIDSLETPRGLLREPPMITYSNLVMHGIMLQLLAIMLIILAIKKIKNYNLAS